MRPSSGLSKTYRTTIRYVKIHKIFFACVVKRDSKYFSSKPGKSQCGQTSSGHSQGRIQLQITRTGCAARWICLFWISKVCCSRKTQNIPPVAGGAHIACHIDTASSQIGMPHQGTVVCIQLGQQNIGGAAIR